VARSGGKVVKNVAGYDLPKLANGCLGTLGVITEAVFRLHPLPHETQTVSFTAPSLETLCEIANAIRDSKLACSCLQLRASSTGQPLLDATFEGTRAGLDAQERLLLQMAAKATRTDSSQAGNAREALWQSGNRRVVAKFSVLPTDVTRFGAMLNEIASKQGLKWKVVAQAIGVGLLGLEAANDDALLEALPRLRSQTEALGGTLVVLSCPLEMKPRFDVWGSPGDALPLMQRVKQELDPAGTLNPGRFVGGI
jgi:glycolate oxidase FAD binding subunit